MKNLSQRIWQFNLQIYYFVDAIFYTLLSFSIWENGKSYELIIHFNLALFAGLLIGGIISGYLSSLISIKFTYLVSLLLRAYIALVLTTNTALASSLVFIGLILGLSYSSFYNASGILTNLIVKSNKLVEFSSTRNVIRSSIRLITPFIIAFLSDQFDFANLLIIIALMFISLSILLVLIKSNDYKEKLQLREVLNKVMYNPHFRSSALIQFNTGINLSIVWGILNIFILELVGSIDNWSIVSTIMVIISIIVAFLIKRTSFKNQSRTKSIILISAFLYSIVPAILLFNSTLPIIIIFLIVKSIFDQITGILSFNYILKLEKDQLLSENNSITLQVFNDIFIVLGEILPIFVLFLISLIGIPITKELLLFTLAVISLSTVLFANAFDEKY